MVRVVLLTTVFLFAAPFARAQFGAQNLPDMSGFAGAIAESVESAPKTGKSIAPTGGAFRSGLSVPSVDPGATARDIGRQLRTAIAPQANAPQQAALAQLEAGMPKALADLEAQLEKVGFARRDLGVAMAFAFLHNYETATKQTVPEGPSVVAAKIVATAIKQHWGPTYARLEPAAQERMYESLLVSTTLLSSFAQQFAQAGKTAEEATMRRAAGQMFQKLIGVPPANVKIAADGGITGLAAGRTGGRGESPATTPAEGRRSTSPRTGRTTAPNPASDGALSAASAGGAQIFVKYSLSYYPSFQTRFDHLLLFPDGTAFDDIPPDPLPRFDAATLRAALKPRDTGRWQKVGDTIVLNFPNQKEPRRVLRRSPRGWVDGDDVKADSSYDIYFPVLPITKQVLLGAWKHKSLVTMGQAGGAAPMVAAGSTGNFFFNPDGTYSNSRENFAGATNANMGDAFKGEGTVGTYSNKNQNAAGRWRLDGPLLTTEKDGVLTVQVAFVMPNWGKNKGINENPDLMIGGDLWERPDKN